VAGVPMSGVICGDISLYSSAIGYAITDQDWRLEINTGREDSQIAKIVRPHLSDPLSKAAAVLYVIRVLQYEERASKVHYRERMRELLINADEYLASFKDQLAEMAHRFEGLEYLACDMWETISLYRDDLDAVMIVDPPWYTGGYDRMFRGANEFFDWDEPDATQFAEDDYSSMMQVLGESKALVLVYYSVPLEDPSVVWGEPWRAVFADRTNNRRMSPISWIIANRSVSEPQITRPALKKGKAKFKLFDGEITEGSKICAVTLESKVGEYYKDLFIHKLPGGFSECIVGILLDGKLVAVLGLHFSHFVRGAGKNAEGKSTPATIVYCFTTPHPSYKRLHKLTLMSATSRWFWFDVLNKRRDFPVIGTPDRVLTVMLTPHPRNMTARGIMKLEKREKLPDGTFKLSYYADVADRTRGDTVQLWLKKYSKYRR